MKYHVFSGQSGLSIQEWVEELQAYIRAHNLARMDQALFIMDHLERDAREAIRYQPAGDRENLERIIASWQKLYGYSESFVTLQGAFFSRQQQEGEGLQEFSLVLLSLMEKAIKVAPGIVPNAEILLYDQTVEHVRDGALRSEFKVQTTAADTYPVRPCAG